MNERIKQITGQVLDEIVPDTWTTLGYDKIKQIQYRTAELIVRECMKMNHEHFSDEDPYSIDSLYRQHFGFQ